jgi:general secretion pathway protein D
MTSIPKKRITAAFRQTLSICLMCLLAFPGNAQVPVTPPEPATPAQAAPAGPQDAAIPIALHFENADLLRVIGIIASELRINYVVDPSVKGSVNINTLGEVRRSDLFPLLQMILRINGATAVQTGNFYRIVPLQNLQRMPVSPTTGPASADSDDRIIMNIIPLRYVAASDMTKILTPFLSEGGHLFSHESGNILIITDSSRSMARLNDLIAQFDTEAFSNQRARLFPVKNSQADKLADDLKNVFGAYGLSGATSAVRFIPIERVNSILAVTANAAVYPEIERWIQQLDQPTTQGGVRTFVYKVENGKAEEIAVVLNELLFGSVGTPARAPQTPTSGAAPGPAAGGAATLMAQPAANAPSALTAAGAAPQTHIRIVPDTINNQLLIHATAQEFEDMKLTLRDIDIIPRQVMIEAKVYEVDLTGDLSAGVSAFLQKQGGAVSLPGGERKVQGSFANPPGGAGGVLNATVGTLVGRTRELLFFLNAAETRSQARVISAPSILASDNIPANINVGTEVPVLTSQALAGGAQAGGSSLFTNTIQNRDTGVLLTITPRINSSGLVNLKVQQEVSAPLAPSTGGIQSPSIQKRSVSTQVVVGDGETIALGGIIQEDRGITKNRVPLLGDIPYVGALFGNTAITSHRTELIVLLTPTVIRDGREAAQATNAFRIKLKDLERILREDQEELAKREAKAAEKAAKEAEKNQ